MSENDDSGSFLGVLSVAVPKKRTLGLVSVRDTDDLPGLGCRRKPAAPGRVSSAFPKALRELRPAQLRERDPRVTPCERSCCSHRCGAACGVRSAPSRRAAPSPRGCPTCHESGERKEGGHEKKRIPALPCSMRRKKRC